MDRNIGGVSIYGATDNTCARVQVNLKKPNSAGYNGNQKGFPIQGLLMFGLLSASETIEHLQSGFGHGPLGLSFKVGWVPGFRPSKKAVNETPKSLS
jgi:hypothetical protein